MQPDKPEISSLYSPCCRSPAGSLLRDAGVLCSLEPLASGRAAEQAAVQRSGIEVSFRPIYTDSSDVTSGDFSDFMQLPLEPQAAAYNLFDS